MSSASCDARDRVGTRRRGRRRRPGPRRFRLGVGVAAALFGTILLGACGSGASRASAIAGADAICEKTQAAIRAEPASEAGLLRASAVVTGEVSQLRGIRLPQSDMALFRHFLAAEAAVAARYRVLSRDQSSGAPEAAAATTSLALAAGRAAALARAYGISGCASAGATVGSG